MDSKSILMKDAGFYIRVIVGPLLNSLHRIHVLWVCISYAQVFFAPSTSDEALQAGRLEGPTGLP